MSRKKKKPKPKYLRRRVKVAPVVGPVVHRACLVCGSMKLAGTTFKDGDEVPLCRGHVTVLAPLFESLRDMPSPAHLAEIERLKGQVTSAERQRDAAHEALEAMRKARPRLREAITELARQARSVASLSRTWVNDDDSEDDDA